MNEPTENPTPKGDKEVHDDTLFGIKLPSWAAKAKDSFVETMNSEKTKAAIDKMENAAKSAGKMVSEKAAEVVKAAEDMMNKGKSKEDKPKPDDENKPTL